MDSKIISWGEHKPHKTGFLWVRLELSTHHGPDESFFPLGLHPLCPSSPTTFSITFAPEYPSFSVALCCQLGRTQRVLELLRGAGWPLCACTVCLEDQTQQVVSYVSAFFIWGEGGLISALFSISRKKMHLCPSLSVKLCLNIKS